MNKSINWLTHIHDAGQRRPIECFKSQVIFRKRTTNDRVLLRKMTNKDKAHYPCPPHQKLLGFSTPGFRPRVFDPVSTLLFDLYHYLEHNGAFWLLPEHDPGPSSQVPPGCWVRYPLGSKRVGVRAWMGGKSCKSSDCTLRV